MRSDSDTADKKIADLERELLGTQEMLALVLAQIGEPVLVTKETVARGLNPGVQIQIDDDAQKEAFVFSLVGNE